MISHGNMTVIIIAHRYARQMAGLSTQDLVWIAWGPLKLHALPICSDIFLILLSVTNISWIVVAP